MYWVSYVKSTLKGGCDVLLGKKVILYGPNGSGKSTIVQSIELALTGQVTDVEGRKSVRQSGALARLFPSTGPMFSEVVLTDGAQDYVFRWEMERKKDGFKSPEHQCPLHVRFPVQDMEAILQGDAKTVGTWLESQVTTAELKINDVLALITPTYRDAAETFMKRHGKTDLIVLSKLAADEAKSLKAAATKARKTAEQLAEGVSSPLLASQTKALELERDSLQSLVEHTGNMTHTEKAKLDQALADTTHALELLSSKTFPTVDPKTTQLVQSLASIKQLITTQIEKFGTNECKVCGNKEKHAITVQLGKIEAAESTIRAKIDTLKQVREHESAVARLTELKKSIKERLDTAVLGGVDASVVTRLKDIQRILSDDVASKRVWANIQRVQNEATHEEAEANQLSLLGKEFKRIGDILLMQNKSAFESAVSNYLSPNEQLTIDIESARIGLLRGTEVHSALSGAEENRVLLALCAAQTKDSTPCVLIPKDRAWDQDTLYRVLVSLVDAPVQILIMSTVAPASFVVGWELHPCG